MSGSKWGYAGINPKNGVASGRGSGDYRSMNGLWRRLLPSLALAIAVAFAVFAAPAMAKDKNHDRIPDSWEKKNHLSLKVKQTNRDPDRDQLNNLGEYKNGTDPHDADTDGDGLNDGIEVKFDLDPTDPTSDDGELPDGQQIVGTIASFDGHTLTINKVLGGSVSGAVDTDTSIECDRSSPIDELDGVCFPTDLAPGVLVNYASFSEDTPGTFDEVDLVNVD
jgi:hypothetical protein